MTTENKNTIQKALAELIETNDVGALEPLLSEGFRRHKPDSTWSAKEEWLAGMRALPLADLEVKVNHVLGDDDHVVLYTHRRLRGGGPGIAVVDIFRFDRGLVAEAWEIIEPVADVAANLLWWRSGED